MVRILKSDSQQFKNAADDINAEMAKRLQRETKRDPIDGMKIGQYLEWLHRTYCDLFDVRDDERIDSSLPADLRWRAAMSVAPIAETFLTVVGSTMVDAVEDEPTTLDGWVYEGELPNFLGSTWFTQEFAARLQRLARGDTAKSTSFGTKGEPIALARYASQFVIDEQTWLNGQATVGAVKLAAAEQARAAARLKDDLVYSLLLSNPTLTADNLNVFHSTHGNKATGGGSVLSATSLDTAIAAIGNQYLKAEEDAYPTHANLKAKYLIVPGDLVGPARRAVRNMVLDDGGDIKVRQESRLSAIGVVDPHSGTVYTGSATNWLLTAKATSRPTVVVAGLNGPPDPQFRSFKLDKGQFGFGFDIVLDIAAAFTDYRGVYFSVGA